MKIPTALKPTGIYVLLAGPSRDDINRMSRPNSRYFGWLCGSHLEESFAGQRLGLRIFSRLSQRLPLPEATEAARSTAGCRSRAQEPR